MVILTLLQPLQIRNMEYCKISLLLITLIMTIQGTTSLQLQSVTVPRHAELRSTVTLSCHFNLKPDGKLYSVKWYKDDHEFYRYMPSYEPKSETFPQPGISLDEKRSGMNRVTLRNLTFISSGTYRCEVTTETPNFQTAYSSEKMTVRALPKGNPVLMGLLPAYSPGDLITANCTSPRSKPEAKLGWFLNGHKMDRFSLVYYAMPEDEEGLKESTLGLRVHAEVSLFHPAGDLELRCIATVEEREWQSTATVRLARLNNQKLAQDHVPGSGAPESTSMVRLVLTCLLSVLVSWRSSTFRIS